MSDEDNLSGIKGMTLAEKAVNFRKWHNIPDKELVVTTFAAPLQAVQRAKMLNADYVGMANGSRRQVFPVNYQFDNWKATYFVGCFNQPLEALENHFNIRHGRPIYHFIGTDVFQMYNNHPMSLLKDLKKAFKESNAVIFANSPRCTRELQECGIDAELLYTPIYNIDQYQVIKPLPDEFTVAVYYSDSNPMHQIEDNGGLTNIPLILDVAVSCPNIKFKIFGGQRKYLPKDIMKRVPGNVEFVGRIPEDKMVDFINECSMVLRSTIHDGFPQIPIQFVCCGRQALVSCPDEELQFMNKLSFEDIIDWEAAKNEVIEKLYQMKDSEHLIKLGTRSKNAKDYYRDLMSEDVYRERIYKCLTD
jgi:hypothetical protein